MEEPKLCGQGWEFVLIRVRSPRQIMSLEVADCGTDCVTTHQKNMVHPAWLEHATFGFVDQRSIQLSYGCRQDGKQFKVSGFRFQVSVAVGCWV